MQDEGSPDPATPAESARPATEIVDAATPATEVTERTAPAADEVPPWMRRAIALFFMWAVGLIVAYWVLGKLKPLIVMLVVALFLALAMEPPVNALAKRGWRRGSATALVAGGVAIVTLGFIAAFGSVAIDQASQLIDNAPRYVRNVVRFLNDEFGAGIDARSLIHDLQSKNGAVHQLGQDLADSAPSIGLAIAEGLFQIIVTFIFAIYLTVDGPRFRRAICSRLPRARQEMVLETWELAAEKTGAYLYSRTIQAALYTAAVWVFLFLLGIPGSLALAIWVGVVSQFIPTIGSYLSLVLPALVTLVNSPIDTIWVLAFIVGYQQFESYWLGPRIARITLKIHPALTIGSVVAGALLFGVVGAVLALPATAVLQALISAHTEEQEIIESELLEEPKVKRRRRLRVPRPSLRRLRARRAVDPTSG